MNEETIVLEKTCPVCDHPFVGADWDVYCFDCYYDVGGEA